MAAEKGKKKEKKHLVKQTKKYKKEIKSVESKTERRIDWMLDVFS